ncbi:thiamine phosphate synthase [Paenibacillus jiagnxiensis]|uniref:thiamine phosphate synthase n=1 Tax=Paenibacillus jiagnxiensis TaxID=3228926 RepID=UPI0033B3263B
MELHLITDGCQSAERTADIMRLLEPDIDLLHIREKRLSAAELYVYMSTVSERGCCPPAKLAVNDRVDAALLFGAGTVQLTSHSLPLQLVKRKFPELRCGASVHSLPEALAAEQAGADYVLFGHIYDTASKPGLPPRGLSSLEELCRAVSIPVIALGGIQPWHVRDIRRAGASGIAVMSGIWKAENPAEAAKEYRSLLMT